MPRGDAATDAAKAAAAARTGKTGDATDAGARAAAAAAAAARPPPLKLLGARIEAGSPAASCPLHRRRLAERAAKAAAKPPSFGRLPSDQSTFEELQADFAKEAAAIDAIVFGEPSDPAIAAAAARAVDNP